MKKLTKKPAKKTMKKRAKKPAKRLTRTQMVDKILSKVKYMCNDASENLYVQDAEFEELEWMLYQYVK